MPLPLPLFRAPPCLVIFSGARLKAPKTRKADNGTRKMPTQIGRLALQGLGTVARSTSTGPRLAARRSVNRRLRCGAFRTRSVRVRERHRFSIVSAAAYQPKIHRRVAEEGPAPRIPGRFVVRNEQHLPTPAVRCRATQRCLQWPRGVTS